MTQIKESNRQMMTMLRSIRERLKKHEPGENCRNADVIFEADASRFIVKSLGEDIYVSYPDYGIRQEIDIWRELMLLQYLETADGTPLAGSWIALSEMRGGLSRGRSFDLEAERIFAVDLGNAKAEEFLAACSLLGGKEEPSKADACAVIYYAPRFPVRVSFWEKDDEFPASGRVHTDAAAEHYLTIEAAGMAAVSVLKNISSLYKNAV